MDNLKSFLKSQHILTVATVGEPVWIYNVFYTVDDDMSFYFASDPSTKHGKFLDINNTVAFSVSWVEDWNPTNKKGIQGLGICERLTGLDILKYGIDLLAKNKGLIKDFEIYKELGNKAIYRIKPSYIKYKDDELNGVRGFLEFDF